MPPKDSGRRKRGGNPLRRSQVWRRQQGLAAQEEDRERDRDTRSSLQGIFLPRSRRDCLVLRQLRSLEWLLCWGGGALAHGARDQRFCSECHYASGAYSFRNSCWRWLGSWCGIGSFEDWLGAWPGLCGASCSCSSCVASAPPPARPARQRSRSPIPQGRQECRQRRLLQRRQCRTQST